MREEFRYLSVSRRDRQWGLYVTGAGVVLNGEPAASVHPPPYYCRWENGRILPEYAAVYHPHSSVEFESETVPYGIVPAGSFVFLCRDVWHRYRPARESNWTEYWVCFGGSYADHLVRRKFFSPQKTLHHVGSEVRLVGVYQRLLDRVQKAPDRIQQGLSAMVMEILESALDLSNGTPDGDIVQQAKSILEQQVNEHVDMTLLAASLGLSYRQFRVRFKQVTGLAPYHYHLQLRIGRAKDLLADSEILIKEIAALLKFDDSYHFSKMFKLYTGMSPSTWRETTRLSNGRVCDRHANDC